MSDGKPQKDPSMDDILSSIRKIIQEDEGRGPAPSGPAMGVGVPIGRPAAQPGTTHRDDDVLLLTDLVDEPDLDTSRRSSKPLSPEREAPPAAAPSSPAAQTIAESTPMTSNPISSAMDRLARAVEEAKPPVAAPDAGPTVGGNRTLEDIVKEMLRPMLQEWIDKNLPQLVERAVDREVQRLTR